MALLKSQEEEEKEDWRNKSGAGCNEEEANSSDAKTSHSRQEGQPIASTVIIIYVSEKAAFMSYRIYCDDQFPAWRSVTQKCV